MLHPGGVGVFVLSIKLKITPTTVGYWLFGDAFVVHKVGHYGAAVYLVRF